MKYLRDTFSYLFVQGRGKRYILIYLLSLIPCAIIAFGFRAEYFLENILSPNDYSNYGKLFLSYFFDARAFIVIAAGFACLSVTTAAITGSVIRHFRIGVFSARTLIHSLNEYLLTSFVYNIGKILLYLVIFVLYTLFSFMWYNLTGPLTYTVLSFVSLFVFLSLLVYTTSALTMWLPILCIKGTYYRESLPMAFYQSRSKQKYFLPGHILCVFIIIITAIVSYFASATWYVSWIIDTIGYTAAYSFLPIFMLSAYFGENRLPREDLNTRYLGHKRRIR